ncbi:MAG TPA: cytochrome c oxidase assembly protein [Roseiflexaceae bacterium]|nr:cytochrome c oxidase assembly protein [Roseiflexaceae bacterium]
MHAPNWELNQRMIARLQAPSSPYAWQWEHALVPLALALVYWLCAGPLRRRIDGTAEFPRARIQVFMIGVLVLFASVATPLDTLSGYLLTAHMIQHLLMTLIVPPLLLLGTPDWMLRPLLALPLARPILRVLTHPVVAFLLFNFVFSAWHVPALYNLALQNDTVHILEHLLFLGTAVLTWWPVFSPTRELPRLSEPAQLLYLFFESLPPTILGALITFAGDPLYPEYVSAPRLWGLSVMLDQQIGGLIMWIPGALVYFTVLTIVFFRWLNRDEYERSRDTRPVAR